VDFGNLEEQMNKSVPIRPQASFLAELEAKSRQSISRCYQCRKCTNGCPLAFAMDYPPNQVMRMIQIGLGEELLGSKTIWVCAACQTCTTRCPNDIDIAHVMDILRQMSVAAGVPLAEPNVVRFHRAVLGSIRRHGRLFELGMVAWYKLSSGKLADDVKLGWEMFRRGKLRFWPARIRGQQELRAMFAARKGR
jgi:heterodisulfide reductase subunit C